MFNSLPEHNMPLESTPLSLVFLISNLSSLAPTFAQGILIPFFALGAPQTI